MDNHDEYPIRISPLKIKYTEYKKKREMFFHSNILNKPYPELSETLEPDIKNFYNKYSYITKNNITDSLFFEYCDYYILNKLISTMLLPLNPYGPTGIGGRGILEKWDQIMLQIPLLFLMIIEEGYISY